MEKKKKTNTAKKERLENECAGRKEGTKEESKQELTPDCFQGPGPEKQNKHKQCSPLD